MAQSNNARVPFIEMDRVVKGETAQQVVCGTESFLLQLDEAFESGSNGGILGSYESLSELAGFCISSDVRVPSGLRLALQAISGNDWKIPFRDLLRSISQKTNHRISRDERPVPGIWGDEETVEKWAVEESEEHQNEDRVAERAENQAVDEAYRAVRDTLTAIIRVAERRILGQPEPVRRRGRISASESENILSEDYIRNCEFIEFLKGEIREGNQHAHRVARHYFSHTKLKQRLRLSHGAVSNSPTYALLREELSLDSRLPRRRPANFEIVLDTETGNDDLSEEARRLLNRIENAVSSGTLRDDLGSTLLKFVMEDPQAGNRLEEIEDMLDKAERGDCPLNS